MQRLSRISFSLVILLGLLCVMQPAWGQQVTAAITGTVVDPGGAPINDATVTATDTDRGTVYTTKTANGGVFNFTRIPIGSYEVRVTATGFETTVQPPPLVAGIIGRLAHARAGRGDAIHPAAIQPVYVRRPDAELDREKRRAGAGPRAGGLQS